MGKGTKEEERNDKNEVIIINSFIQVDQQSFESFCEDASLAYYQHSTQVRN
jgi:hypothetical protein